ncbi:MAG: glucose 1-dehydrogenase [Nitratireductor sp.]|nr:glucose 1-dehydrogenase [Nitratireductor sp.]
MNMFDLKGRVAVVTGGNGGIGLGMALGLAKAGADIVIASRNAEKNAAAEAELRATGVKAMAIATDIRDPDACKALIEKTVAEFGRVDILVNNSGINFRKQPQDFTLEEYHDVMDTNLTAAFVLSQAVYPHFIRQGGGKIINIGSIASFMASPIAVAYAPSKGGIVQMAKALAVAWAKDNIQINAILPGWIDTPLSVKARAAIPGLEESVKERTPAGRWGTPEDFAGAAVFLASSASDFVNGATLVVDGGYSSKA